MTAGSDWQPFTEADCAQCQRICAQSHADWQARLDKLAKAGFDLPSLRADNDANKTWAEGILREFFPGRSAYPQPS